MTVCIWTAVNVGTSSVFQAEMRNRLGLLHWVVEVWWLWCGVQSKLSHSLNKDNNLTVIMLHGNGITVMIFWPLHLTEPFLLRV